MADILPKVKLYLFMSIFAMIMSIGVVIAVSATTGKFDFIGLFGELALAWVPFASTIGLTFSSVVMPVEALAFIAIFSGIVSAIQTYLILEIVISHIPFIDT